MPFVFMTESHDRFAIGQSEIPLGSLQGLNRRLFIDTEDYGILWRRQVQTDNGSGFGGEFRIRADTPTVPSRQGDIVLPENAPDLVNRHIAQRFRHQRTVPLAYTPLVEKYQAD